MRRDTRDFIGMMLAAVVVGAVAGVFIFLLVPPELYVLVGLPVIFVTGIALGEWYVRRWE